MLLPAILALVPVVELALRLALPPGALAFRGWEAASAGARWPAPFAPDVRFETTAAWGDLANMANRRDLRAYHAEAFTTDALGCRNDPAWARERRIDALYLGSSIGAGVGQSDSETIPALVSRATGRRVYNAAAAPNPPRELITRIADHFGFKRGPVLREVLVRGTLLSTLGGAPPRASDGAPAASPVRVLAQRAVRALEDDVLLPNRARDRVATLPVNGAPVLMLHDDLGAPAPPPRDGLVEWLVAQRYAPTIVLVPTKYQVLRPDQDRAYAAVAAWYRAAGHPVIDLLPALRAARDSYWSDDSHLTPAGARAAATEIARLWRPAAP